VLTYNWGDRLADGVPADRTRSSYVHPIWGLDGEVLTDDFPADHHHHRGLSLMWPRMRVGELECELWHIRGIRSVLAEIRSLRIEDGVAVLEIANRWRLLDAGRDVANEDLTLRVHRATASGRAVDVAYRLEATAEPIELCGQVEKGYGGLNLRFAPRADTVLTTAAGRDARSSDHGRFDWADLSARFAGRTASSGIAILVARDHPDAPPPWSLRHYGDLNVAWPGLEPVVLAPKAPVTLRYRLWIHRGDAAAGGVAAAYRELAGK
jgi:hypothetical protein